MAHILPQRRPLDLAGFWMLLTLSFVFASNNVLIKLGNEGLQPVFFAAARSVVAGALVAGWMVWRRIDFRPDLWRPGLLIGAAFSAEFFFLFVALDQTTVVRASVLFYAMPLWLAGAAHFLFPGERLSTQRVLGFGLGFAAVVLVLVGQAQGDVTAAGSLTGDLAALAAGMSWAAIVIIARLTRLQGAPPDTQIFWQLLVSAPILLTLAPLYGGSFVRAFDGVQLTIFLTHALCIAAGFVTWFWLLQRYPSSSVASFSFLTPVLSAGLGWLVLSEPVTLAMPVALALLVAGLILINRRPRV
ncbi:DMT family transporter [Pararhodobacter sp. SW119]|uniref:DMT family transporter n=1 Tax=Pararhodobacter sp. SW119 TaxID=2780075 RepID=UPI001ADFF2C1|nr:DMT family transporter [Pararhodobacter sp. SW119]